MKILIKKIIFIIMLLLLLSFIFFNFTNTFINTSNFRVEFGFPIPFMRIQFSDYKISPVDYLKRTSIDLLLLYLDILIYNYIYSIIYKKYKKTNKL